MNDDDTTNDESPADEIDVGEPIRELADLGAPVRAGFVARLRNKIERRSLTSQVASLSWDLPRAVILEVLSLIFELFSPKQDPKGGPR